MKIRTVWAVPIFAALLVSLTLALWLSYFGSPPAPQKAHIAGEDLCAAAAAEAGFRFPSAEAVYALAPSAGYDTSCRLLSRGDPAAGCAVSAVRNADVGLAADAGSASAPLFDSIVLRVFPAEEAPAWREEPAVAGAPAEEELDMDGLSVRFFQWSDDPALGSVPCTAEFLFTAEEAGWAYDLRFRVRYFAVPQSREAALSAAQEFFSALFSAPQA